jgi:hypothetical protein
MRRHQHGASEIRQILALVAMLGVPAAITLYAVQPRPGPGWDPMDPTPSGYTISLTLFAIPCAVMLWQLLRHPASPTHRHALVAATAVMALVGFVLDLFFGESFFTFPNRGATLEWHLPAWSFAEGRWVPDYLPPEEFAFYILGGLFFLTLYAWIEERWLRDDEPEARVAHARALPRLLHIHWPALLAWGAAIVAGLLFKRYVTREPGIPGYFLFIMCIGVLPTVLFLHAVQRFVNWRAFAQAFVILLLVELLWEATLGVPFDWWNYKEAQMLGIRIAAWAYLPIEAVLLWVVVAWDCIVVFEICRVYLHMDDPARPRPARARLFGAPAAD